MGPEGAKGIKNNLTQEVPLGALEVEIAKGFLQESIAAMTRLSCITLIKILFNFKESSQSTQIEPHAHTMFSKRHSNLQ